MFMILGKSATAIEIPRKQEKRKRIIISIINFFQPTNFMMFPPSASEFKMCTCLKVIKNRQKQHRQSIQTVTIHQYRILNLEEMYGKIKKDSYYRKIFTHQIKIRVFLPKMSSEVVNFSNLTNFALDVYLSERKTKRQDGNTVFLDGFRKEPILSNKSSIAQFLTQAPGKLKARDLFSRIIFENCPNLEALGIK